LITVEAVTATAQLLYLGAHDGMQVLYDRTKKHVVLVPTGSVALVLSS